MDKDLADLRYYPETSLDKKGKAWAKIGVYGKRPLWINGCEHSRVLIAKQVGVVYAYAVDQEQKHMHGFQQETGQRGLVPEALASTQSNKH